MKVAIYAIAYNEEERAADWAQHILKSLRYGDRIVVADLGSTDKTRMEFLKAMACPTSIYIQPFRFDLARNAALALVPPDINCCICLDLDERLADGWRDALDKAWFEESGANYSTIKYQYSPGMIFDDARRVHSRFGWRWRYPAHEGLYSYGIKAIQSPPIESPAPFIIHHQNLLKERRQYLDLLKIGLDENPESCRMLHYYGRELYYRGLYGEALPYLEKYYTIKPAGYSNPWEEECHKNLIASCRYYCNVATGEKEVTGVFDAPKEK